MSIETLVTLLKTEKFDVHYGVAPDGTPCPYIVLTDIEHPNFAADNKTFTKTTSLRITLVESEVHDWTLISKLEKVLDSIPLPYSATDNQEPSEHVCESYYDISFLGGTENA